MTGSASDHQALIRALEDHDRAERIANLMRDGELFHVSDKLFLRVNALVFACGFKPGGEHRNLTVLEYARQRVEAFEKTFPLHAKEARQ